MIKSAIFYPQSYYALKKPLRETSFFVQWQRLLPNIYFGELLINIKWVLKNLPYFLRLTLKKVTFNCVVLSWNVGLLEWIYTL